jgi:sugar phosphate permease
MDPAGGHVAEVHRTAVVSDTLLQQGAIDQSVAATRTRWWMLVLFSLMYLICYLDRGIISVAQPEIRETFGLTLSQMGLILAAFTGRTQQVRFLSDGSATASGPRRY